jgi:hypothetical protein
VRAVELIERDDAGPSRAVDERPTRSAKGKGKVREVRVALEELGDDEERAIGRRVLAETIARKRQEIAMLRVELEGLEGMYKTL